MEFDANGALLRITTVQELAPHQFTALGWNIDNIDEMIKALTKNGISFEKYDFL